MSQLWSAIIVPTLAALVPFIGWLSSRATKAERLLHRVRRLGAAYAVLPDGPERETFGAGLTSIVAEFNAWNAPTARQLRTQQRLASAVVWALGFGAVVAIASLVPKSAFWSQVVSGVIVGAVGAALAQLLTWWLARRQTRKIAEQEALSHAEAEATRLESLRRGLAP